MADRFESGVLFPLVSRGIGVFASDGSGVGEPDKIIDLEKDIRGFYFKIFSDQAITFHLDGDFFGTIKNDIDTQIIAANDPTIYEPLPEQRLETPRIRVTTTVTTTFGVELVDKRVR